VGAWQAFHAYGTSDTGALTGGSCSPTLVYKIWNFYCKHLPGAEVEEALNGTAPCMPVTRIPTSVACDTVEAFIQIQSPASFYPPVFYRCYWRSDVTAPLIDILQFEWSATTEYITWYMNQYYPLGNPATGSAYDILISSPYNIPSSTFTSGGVCLVPILKVTNHSPQL
jgi:hypothetical protein